MERRIDETGSRRSTFRLPGATWLAALLAVAGSCNTNIFDVTVDLSAVSVSADLGTTNAALPAVTCDPAMPSACVLDAAAFEVVPYGISVATTCDPATLMCFADASAIFVQQVDVPQDDTLTTRVERGSTSFLHSIDIAYTMPVNTLNFDVPGVDVYVGPTGSSDPTSPGVVLVDTIPSIPAGMPFTDRRHITLAEGTASVALVEQSIRTKSPFVFIVVLKTPRLDAGDPVPAGAVQFDLFPTVSVGL